MALTIIENACVFDGFHDELSEGQNLVIENDIIREISSEPVKSQSGTRIDVKGGTVMPGLIDAHVHVTDWNASPAELIDQPSSLTTLFAARNLKKMLYRGFTTVRDACGADFGLAAAVDQGMIFGTLNEKSLFNLLIWTVWIPVYDLFFKYCGACQNSR